MRKIICFITAILIASFCWQSCEDEDDSLDTITLSVCRFHNSCNFESQYKPFSSGKNPYKDDIHEVGQHVLCSIDGKLYEVEILEKGDRLGAFFGIFHVVKCEGKDIAHEDDKEWYIESYILKLDTHSKKLDTTFIPRYYQKSESYGQGIFLPQDIVARIVTAIDTAYALDQVAEANGTDRGYETSFIRPEMIYEGTDSLLYFYHDENGYYYQKGKRDFGDYKKREGLSKTYFDPNALWLILPFQGYSGKYEYGQF